MKLIKRNNKRPENRGGTSLAKRGQETFGLAPTNKLGREIGKTWDRMWRNFDRDPWEGLGMLSSRLGELWRPWQEGLSQWPAIDMAEDDKTLTLRVDAPGLNEKDLNGEVSGNLLTIRGQRQDE